MYIRKKNPKMSNIFQIPFWKCPPAETGSDKCPQCTEHGTLSVTHQNTTTMMHGTMSVTHQNSTTVMHGTQSVTHQNTTTIICLKFTQWPWLKPTMQKYIRKGKKSHSTKPPPLPLYKQRRNNASLLTLLTSCMCDTLIFKLLSWNMWTSPEVE